MEQYCLRAPSFSCLGNQIDSSELASVITQHVFTSKLNSNSTAERDHTSLSEQYKQSILVTKETLIDWTSKYK